MRRALLLVTVCATTAFVACDPGIEIKIENKSDALVCFHELGTRPIDLGSCADDVQPGKSAKWSVICQSDWEMTFVLTSGERQIYSGSAKCGEWEETSIVVEGSDGVFHVNDGLDP